MVRHLVLGWIPYRRTRSEVLWTILEHTGKAVAIAGNEEVGYCVPVFSTQRAADEWILKMGRHLPLTFEQHFPSAPLYPRLLASFLTKCKMHGFSQVALDPPADSETPFPAAPIEYMIQQARDKVARKAAEN